MALIDVYNALYEGGELKARATAAVFLKAKSVLADATTTPDQLNFARRAYNNPDRVVVAFMPDLIGHTLVQQALQQKQLSTVTDEVISGVVNNKWAVIASMGG